MKYVVAALVVTAMLGEAAAQPANNLTGNVLLATCQNQKNANTCYGYIHGVADSIMLYQDVMKSPRIVCIPGSIPLTQARDVVVQYLEKNPSVRHQDAAGLIFVALSDAFPCKK